MPHSKALERYRPFFYFMLYSLLSGSLAIAAYSLATLYSARELYSTRELEQKPIAHLWLSAIGVIAIGFHALSAFRLVFTPSGIDLGLSATLSLSTWIAALLFILAGYFRPIGNAGIVIYPVAGLSILLSLLFNSQYQPRAHIEWGISLHILFSITAYSLLAVAFTQSILLALQNRELKRKHTHGLIQHLPPLQTMESVLFEILWLGVVLLSLAIVSGFLFVDDFFAQHLAHKTFFSICAWAIFAILLWGRHRLGWRGKTAVRWTNTGFIFLALGYLGSKFVLELILYN